MLTERHEHESVAAAAFISGVKNRYGPLVDHDAEPLFELWVHDRGYEPFRYYGSRTMSTSRVRRAIAADRRVMGASSAYNVRLAAPR